ncbi:hypothetical protein CF336_g5677 [Tilletia laevis]|uniref:Uncharacterized protein n=1 Tax=Tilletia caries TaxID=13290 RepID=A0A177U436_9BASI|nr:hypothetical protein CF336_g5677 [Tilletia laevis]KAE8254968.1 hypothetical protein A4X03_0g5636 [Tilletia caries]
MEATFPSSSSSAGDSLPPPYLDDDDDDLPPHTHRQSSLTSISTSSQSASSASSASASASSYDSEEEARIAQEEWDDGIHQLQLALQLIFLPYLGKYLGRRYAYTIWNRYLRYGPTSSFFGFHPVSASSTSLAHGGIWARMNSLVPSWAVALVSTAADA